MPSNQEPAARLYTARNTVELIRGGKEFFRLLGELIDNARHVVHLQTYIYDEDETGIQVGEALKRAVSRGVKVYLLVDGYASQNLSRKFRDELIAAGIQFRWFEPLFKGRHFYFGRRLHHKIAVADGCRSLVGGINISNKYNDMEGEPAWLDWAVLSTGEVSAQLHRVCVRVWNRSDWKTRKRHIRDTMPSPDLPDDECQVRVRVNDWVRRRNQISRTYLEMLRNAEKSVTIMSSYFMPGRAIKRFMVAAVKRGVKVKVIIAGPSDVVISKQAERYMYAWLFRHGIEVYEYTKTVLHGKISTYDGKFVTIGSYNLNNISAFASIELNLDIMNPKFAARAEESLQAIIEKDCVRVKKETFEKKNHLLMQLWQWTCY
ncbi:MAG: phospholipase D/Transphosphatidylase, partial [Chitinophagaceae bacterium]|nr:phospholipase D/Transphosphatidylase [Chitinophagaceae bacterium]